MMKVSIIIPVYNVESYIRKCLDSVVNQTYRNLEIICVDDGSTDQSGEICEEYARRDSRFTVIRQENRGHPSAVNAGLDHATGDYVSFIDSDDWIEPIYYESVCREFEDNLVDIVCTGISKDTDKHISRLQNHHSIEQGRLNREQVLKYTFIRDQYPAFCAYLCNKVFRASFFRTIEQNGCHLRLNEDLQIADDLLLFVQCVLHANYSIYLDETFYHYFQRSTSLMHSNNIKKRADILKAYTRVIVLLAEYRITNDIMIWIRRFYVYHASLLAELSIANDDKVSLVNMQCEMKRYLDDYISTNQEYPERLHRIHRLSTASI